MRISTDASIIGDLLSLSTATYSSSAPTTLTATTTSADFGPAAIVSLGQSSSATGAFGSYSFLAGVAAGLQTQPSVQLTAEQLEAEQETIKRAAALRLSGQYDAARELAEDVLDRNPTSALAVHALGAIELDLGHYEKAEKYFNRAHYLNPDYGFDSDAANARTLQRDDEYVLEQARLLVARGETREAGVRLLYSLTRRSPSNAVARSLLGENLIRLGDSGQGLAQYQLAISSASADQLRIIQSRLEVLLKAAPQAAYLHNLLGQTQLKLGEHEQAAETLALATQLAGDDPLYKADEALAHVALGRDALARGDLNAAMISFRTAQELAPRRDEVTLALAEGYLARGRQRARLGDPGRAIEEYNAARSALGEVENEPFRAELADAYYRAGRTLEWRRISTGADVGDELIAFRAAYQLDSDNPVYRTELAETYNTLGDQYAAEGDHEQAAYAYRDAYEIDADEDYQQSAITHFLAWGDERSAARDHLQAITAYQAAYDLDRDNETAKFSLAEAFNTRGLFYRSLGEDFYDLAAEDFLSALHLYPDNEDYQANYDSVK